MGELIVRKKNELAKSDDTKQSVNVMQIDLTAMDHAKAQGILSYAVQQIQAAADLGEVISPQVTYFLNVPKEIREGLASGEYWLTRKSATGEMLASVSHEVEGKKQFLANLTVEEGYMVSDMALHNLSDGIYKMAVQQQMAAMTAKLEEIHRTVVTMEKGQKDDRFGKITGAQNQLRFAMSANDPETQKAVTIGAIQTLAEGTGQIQEALKTKIVAYKAIPQSDFRIYMKMLFYPGNYKNDRDREFDEIQEYFDYYEKATKLWACASLMVDEPDAMKEIFAAQQEYLLSLDVSKLQTIKYLHPELDMHEEWFFSPEKYVTEAKEQYIRFADDKYGYIAMEVKGEQLLEALENGKNAGSEENREDRK